MLGAVAPAHLHPSPAPAPLPRPQVEMKALGELIAHKLPRLAAHFAALEVDVGLIATDW